MSHDSFGFLRIPLFHQFWNPTQFGDPLSFGIPDEPPCYAGQYASMSTKSHIYIYIGWFV